ncbi:MAG: thioredoxin domain-containing protein, partial [Bacteroidota bacterium]
IQGDPNAPVTIIEYASLTCPHCRDFHKNEYPTIKEKYVDTGIAKLYFREFPFDPAAAAGFMLAQCAGEDKYFSMIDIMFERQSTWTRGKVVISLKDYGIIRNTRGDKNGNVFSEVYYTRLSPVEKYFPVRITSVYAIDYGKDDYYVCNRMICFTQITNNEKLMSAYKPIQRVARKKSISEIKYKASDEVDADRMMLRIPAPKAEAVEAARREYQRQQLGLQAEEGEK